MRRKAFVIGLGGNAGSGKSAMARELGRLGAEVIDADRIGWSLLKKTAPAYPRLVKVFGKAILDRRSNVDRKALGSIVFADAGARAELNRIVHPALLAEIRRRVKAAFRNPHSAIRQDETADYTDYAERIRMKPLIHADTRRWETRLLPQRHKDTIPIRALVSSWWRRRTVKSAKSVVNVQIAVIDAALLFLWNWQREVDLAILVTAAKRNKLARLQRAGLSRAAALDRLGSQLPESRMRKLADLVIENNGTIGDLRRRTRRFWQLLQQSLAGIL